MLTDLTVRQAKTTGQPYTIADFNGLALFVSATGAKTWHFRYTWGGKGTNPRTERKQKLKAVKLAGENTFMVVYERWMAHRQLTLPQPSSPEPLKPVAQNSTCSVAQFV